MSRPTVILWRKRFQQLGVEGLLRDAPRPGRKRRMDPEKEQAILHMTLESKPTAATHWSSRSLARLQGMSFTSVQRIWRKYGLKPHLTRTFKISNDPQLVDKVKDIVGLYMNPPDKALVLSVDEKSQIQALDRTQPMLPMRPGQVERHTHDYVRHGTTTLFAALNLLEGTVIGKCMSSHTHQELLQFLKQIDRSTPKELDLHLILDNYGTHKHAKVNDWLAKHPRFHLHFTPTGCSWLNLIERWFSELTTKRIRRGSFDSVPALVAAIDEYLANHNRNPASFVWHATAESIIAKINHCKEVLVS